MKVSSSRVTRPADGNEVVGLKPFGRRKLHDLRIESGVKGIQPFKTQLD